MAIIIEQGFPLGRFHARCWNQPQFDENAVEWPPSPWRLLRAIVARWYQYSRETGDYEPKKRDRVLSALAGGVPAYRLPCEATGQAKLLQYQPTEVKFTKKKGEAEMRRAVPTLVPDGFRIVPKGETVLWVWGEAELASGDRALLSAILARVHYFGRSESLTHLRLLPVGSPVPQANCALTESGLGSLRPVLVNMEVDGLFERILELSGESGGAIPRGTRYLYANPPEGKGRPNCANPCDRRAQRMDVARFSLSATVLPLVTESLRMAEMARWALMSHFGRATEQSGERGKSRVFSGKDEDGRPLGQHGHAFYLPTDEDGDGRLDHLTVFAPDGFGPEETRALNRLNVLRDPASNEGRKPVRALLLGLGAAKDYHPGPLRASGTWVSVSPYIATRYAKTRGQSRVDLASPEARAGFLVEDLNTQVRAIRPDLANWVRSGLRVEPLWDDQLVFRIGGRWRPIEFQRYRRKRGDEGGRYLAGAFRLRFPEAVAGPLVFGRSSHFGMGLFLPEFDAQSPSA